MSAELITSAVALLLTVMVLSYLIGDNPLFRVAIYVFVGVAAGYVVAVAWWQVLWPDLVLPFLTGTTAGRTLLAVPLLLSGLLIMRAWPRLSGLGMPAMGLLVGAAAAVAVGGATIGTLLPQVNATIASFGAGRSGSLRALLNSALVLVGVVTSLAYFHFGARARADGSVQRMGLLEIMAAVGGVFLAITLGVLFAGAYAASLTALIERLHFLVTFSWSG